MAYGFDNQVPTYRQRPATVLISTLLLSVVPLFAAVFLAAQIMYLGPYRTALEEISAGTPQAVDSLVIGAGVYGIGTGVVYLLLGLALGVLALFNNMGKNGSRIATWVVGGLGFCCGGLSLAGLVTGMVAGALLEEELARTDEVGLQRSLDAHIPGWYEPVTWATNGLGVLVVALALILLMLPTSNQYFRKQVAEPGSASPGYYQPGPGGHPMGGPPPMGGYPGGPPPPGMGGPPGPPPPAGYPQHWHPPSPPGSPPPAGYPQAPAGYPQASSYPQQPGSYPQPGAPPAPPPPQPPPAGSAPPAGPPDPAGGGTVHEQPTTLERWPKPEDQAGNDRTP